MDMTEQAKPKEANALNPGQMMDVVLVIIGPGFIVEDTLRGGTSVSADELAEIRCQNEIKRPGLLEKYKHVKMHQPFIPYQPDPRTIDTRKQ